MTRHYHTLLLSGIALLGTSASWGQTVQKDTTMNRTVVVEQNYNPIIPNASKINVLPKIEEPQISKKSVEYATAIYPATALPDEFLKAYVPFEKQSDGKSGYARLGYGNYGNLDVLGNYLFRLSKKDRLNARLQMDGRDGTFTLPQSADEQWSSYYYRTQVALDYLHQFRTVDLGAGGHWGVSNFNLLPPSGGKQHFSSGDLYVQVKSTEENLPVQFEVETGMLWYDRQKSPVLDENDREMQLRLQGFIRGAINDQQSVTIASRLQYLSYTNAMKAPEALYQNRTLLDLNPYYGMNTDNWRLRLGANVDFSFGSGKTLRFSPDLKADYMLSDGYVLYGQATGGRQLNDFRRLEQLCPYALPINVVNDTYEQLNAALGFKMSPYPGLWFNVYGGYQNVKDELYESGVVAEGQPDHRTINLKAVDATNAFVGLKTAYQYKDLFSLNIDGVYRHWKADTDPSATDPLALKPQLKASLEIGVRPIAGLLLNTGYVYTSWSEKGMPKVNNLYLNATYKFYKGASLYARFDNMLNKSYQYHLFYPTEGFNFVGGVSFEF